MAHALIDWLNTISTYWTASMLRGIVDGGLVVASVWAVCTVFKRIPASVRYWLWWLACAKLLLAVIVLPTIAIPVLPASMHRSPAIVRLLSPSKLPSQLPAVADGHAHMSLAHAVNGGHFSGATADHPDSISINRHRPNSRPRAHVAVPPPSISPLSIIMLLWLAVVLALSTVAVLRAISMAGIVRRGRRVDLADIVDMPVSCPVRVIVADRAPGLCVTGLLRPVLLVPSTWPSSLSESEKRMAVAHELAHLRRGDLWLGIVPATASILFFFFPLVRLAARACAQACEEACDIDALRSAGCSVADYAGMLLKSAAPRPAVAGSLGVSPAYRQLHARLTGLAASTHSPSALLKLVAAAIVTALLVALAPWRLTAKASPNASPTKPRQTFRYALVDLGPISGDDASHFQINNLGQIIGTSNGHPFLWHDGKVDPLSTLWYHNGRGGGIGNTGVYAVTCYSDAGNPHAFWFRSGIHLMKGLPGYHFTVARGIADNGWIVGTAQHSGSDLTGAEIARAVLWTGQGRTRDLGTLGGRHGAAYAVNAAGQIVGKADLPLDADGSRPTHAFLWQNGVMHDLGTLGGSNSFAYAVNDRGEAAGFSQIAGDTARHACLWQDGTPIDLGVLQGDTTSEAHGINGRGQVVGTSDSVPNAGDNRAVLWQDGTAIDLNKSVRSLGGWHLDDAMAINDSGLVVGKGRVGGAMHAFALTPIPPASDKSDRGMGVPPVHSSEG
jgi:probable HAF family extracellular repeat protein